MNTLLLAATCLMAASPAPAQQWESDACADASIPMPYVTCVLHLDGDELTRGRGADVVMVAAPGKPFALSRMVRGDSARYYARRYEHAWVVGGKMQLVGGALLLGGSIAMLTGKAHLIGPLPERKVNKPLAAVMGTGLGLIILSQPFRWRSLRDAHIALDLSNAQLTR